MKILIVDDVPDNIELVSQVLEDENHEIIKAGNGADCLKLAKEQHPDLILLDVMMPKMNGYEVMTKLQENEDTRNIIVIYISARYKDTDRVIKGLELGAFDYLTKPIEDEILLAKIKSAWRIKKAEDALVSALKEKEILLHETHHRVKNNMAIISSLLELHINSIEDPISKDILRASKIRVCAMAAIHRALHESENLSKVNLQHYTSKLSATIFDTYMISPGRIIFKNDVEETAISLKNATPIGLIINELFSNALKYAFPDDRSGEITVGMKKIDNELVLTVSDDGIGMPEDLDWRKPDTLGLKLVRSLAEDQLNGSVEMINENGTKFTIKLNAEAR